MRSDIQNKTNKPFYPIDPAHLENVTVTLDKDRKLPKEDWKLPKEFYLNDTHTEEDKPFYEETYGILAIIGTAVFVLIIVIITLSIKHAVTKKGPSHVMQQRE